MPQRSPRPGEGPVAAKRTRTSARDPIHEGLVFCSRGRFCVDFCFFFFVSVSFFALMFDGLDQGP